MNSNELVLLIVSILFFTYFIFSIFLFVRMKKYIDTMKNGIKELDIPKETMSVRTESSKQLLQIIDDMITLKILSKRKFEVFLNQKNKNLDMDNMIKTISTEVLKALKENVLIDSSTIFTQEYLMQYIIDKTTISYITYIQNNVAGQL